MGLPFFTSSDSASLKPNLRRKSGWAKSTCARNKEQITSHSVHSISHKYFQSFNSGNSSLNNLEVSEVTLILEAVKRGDSKAAEELLPLVYDELRKLAAAKMARESPGQTLQPTALVHEAWLRLVDGENQAWQNRAHFFSAAAEAMRRILIERARKKRSAMHGGGWQRVELEGIDLPARADEGLLFCINDSLEALAREDPQAAELVKLRFFAGLNVEEAALAMGVTDRTARRYWRFARAWLYDDLDNPESRAGTPTKQPP